MKLKMQLTRHGLDMGWAFTSAAAIAVLLVLQILDTVLRARTGAGSADLQGAGTGWDVRFVMDHWASPPDSVLVGFLLGFDFLFIPLYGAALYFGSIAAREQFAPKPGRSRRILDALSFAPLAAAIADVCENTLQIVMLTVAPSDTLAGLAFKATIVKFAGIFVGLMLSIAAALKLAAAWKGKKGGKG